MTAPRLAVVETSLPRVREYLDRVVSDAIREAAEAVRIVDEVRAYLHALESAERSCCARGGCVACRERWQIVTHLRGLLGDETWRCAWCQQPVSSLPCTNSECPGRR